MPHPAALIARPLGRQPYRPVWRAMRAHCAARGPDGADELWWLEHDPVYTLGQAGRRAHLRAPGAIPVVNSDRGGQVTYHGPGQLVVYCLIDLKRARLGVRRFVHALEQSVIDLLAEVAIEAQRRAGAPGVYVGEAKIAALGLRVRNGCTYHGLALNVDLDLEPFSRIDPCGYPGLPVTRLRDLGVAWGVVETAERLLARVASVLGRRLVHGEPVPIRDAEEGQCCAS